MLGFLRTSVIYNHAFYMSDPLSPFLNNLASADQFQTDFTDHGRN